MSPTYTKVFFLFRFSRRGWVVCAKEEREEEKTITLFVYFVIITDVWLVMIFNAYKRKIFSFSKILSLTNRRRNGSEITALRIHRSVDRFARIPRKASATRE